MSYNKTRLLTINNSGWGDRSAINEIVSRNFNYTVRNSYNKKKRTEEKYIDGNGGTTLKDYIFEIASSKFVLCPSGLGFDTYRLWETLLLGAVPIVESNAGFDRTYSNLPVLIVRDFADISPKMLEDIYPCFIRNAANFLFEHLREDYWLELVKKAIYSGKIDHVQENHPIKNRYCGLL